MANCTKDFFDEVEQALEETFYEAKVSFKLKYHRD